MKKGSPKTIYLKDYTPPPYLIDAVTLRFDLGEEVTVVLAKLTVRRNPAIEVAQDALILAGEHLQLESVKLNGCPLDDQGYKQDSESLTIYQVPSRFELEIVTRIKPQENTSLEGLYKSSGNFCTQCEAEGFRKITYFLDRPDVMAVYTTTLVADKDRYPVLLSNGNLVDRGELDQNRHFATWQDPYPKPSYLFALVAGRLVHQEDSYRTRSGRTVTLRVYVQAHNRDKCDHAIASLKKAMQWDEQSFGLEYDLDTYMIVAVDDFNMGAMENKGLNVFNSKYVLARPETATDDDYMNIEGVIAHEYFHNWTGNRVTCRDWFQLSLKEGLTVFRDQQFTADATSKSVKRIHDVRLLRTYQFAEDAGPMAHPVRPQAYMEINNFYTVTVYEKGAEVVRMYDTLLGREGFRQGMDLYFKRHDGQAVTTDDFLAAMADANHYELAQFKRWYDQAGTPELAVEGHWDVDSKTYTLNVVQRCPPTPEQEHKEPFLIPLKVGLLGSDGRDIPLRLEGENRAMDHTRVLSLRDEHERYTFLDVSEHPVPSLLREFSAPVNVHYDYSDEELAFLFAHDSDAFNRWEAGQRIAIKNLERLIAQHQAGETLELDSRFINAFAHTLNDKRCDSAYIAEALSLPSEAYLAESVAEIDVDAIHAAREFMRQTLATALESSWVEVYHANETKGEYVYNAADAGRRRLKNLCLSYLTTMAKSDYASLSMEQFLGANNMTDTMGALHALNHRDCPERSEALQQFYERWHQDTLVVDKWLSLQATSNLPNSLERVKQLKAHPLFSIKNPNKVRSVIGVFAHTNAVNFHQRSGAGYGFVADTVLELDPINPQVAARLAKAFSRWKKHDAQRRDLMRNELKRMSDSPGISKDLFEVVSKSLE